MIRAGIIGAGYAADLHAHGYAALPASRVQLAVVADRHRHRAGKLAQRYGAIPVTSLDAMLASGVDAISICTPTASHAEIAIAAMHAGINVLCEKPIARTLAGAERMIQVSQQTGAKLMAAHVTRFESEHLKAREVLDRGVVPYYGTTAVNVWSMRTAISCGFYPAWVHMFARDVREDGA